MQNQRASHFRQTYVRPIRTVRVAVCGQFRGQNDRTCRRPETHPVGHSAGQDGLDDDAGGPAADDAETEAGAVVHQVNDLHLRPLCVQLPADRVRGEVRAGRWMGRGEDRREKETRNKGEIDCKVNKKEAEREKYRNTKAGNRG